MTKQRWDIFCKVVDNFGDIGICWRLAKQLQHEYGLQIRLWVDDLTSAQKIVPSLNVKLNQQVIDGINITKWPNDDKESKAYFSQAADVVIETFACELPTAYLASMKLKKSKWINLEYLSAESWVDDFHGKPSPQANDLTRHFYFPGFTPKTGGLIHEANIFAHLQNAIRSHPQTIEAKAGGVLNISLFCYPFAPIADLFDALQANNHAVHVYVPQSSILPTIAQFFGKNSVKVGDKLFQNNLSIEILPFLIQADYDVLLQNCDLNFVRGEDSWVRAIWAGKPFIWQPYFQDENAHIKKLDAFLDYYYADFDNKQLVCEAHRCWSAGMPCNDLVKVQLPNAVLNEYLSNLGDIHTHTQRQSIKQKAQLDLATQLVSFCDNLTT